MTAGPDRADLDGGDARARTAWAGPWLQAAGVALLLAGLWQRDCVLLAGAPLLAQRSLPLQMERSGPWCPLRASTRAFTAGLLSAAAALALGLHVLGVQLGWWWAPGGAEPGATTWLVMPTMLLAPALLLVALQRQRERMGREALFWLGTVAAAALTAWAPPLGNIALACIFAAGVALLLLRGAWRFAHDLGPDLLRQAAYR